MIMSKVSKNKQQLIRPAILQEFKLGNNPFDASQKIQKLFGFNFETRLSTIKLWFEQFCLGDESLENDPFREDLVPMKRKTRKKIIATNSSSPNSNETKLLFELKEQVDLLYQKINAQNCCLQLVDGFIEKYPNNKRIMSSDSSGNHQNTYETFCKNYRFLRKKCHLLSIKINFYDILYKHIYSAVEVVEKNNNSGNKRRKQRRSQSKKSLNPTNSHVPKRKRGRPRSNKPAVVEKKKKKLRQKQVSTVNEEDLLPATCPECHKVFKNRARMQIHVKQIHQRTERRYCKFEGCEVNYARQSDLTRHIRIVHTKDAREFRCTWTGCSYLTYTSDMLRKHLNVHTGERPYKCVWPGCDKAFKSHSALAFHKSIHKNERQYKCKWPGCGYACNLSSNLNKHTAGHERKQFEKILHDFGPSSHSTTETNQTIIIT